ncbi:hypothetical protein CJ430_31255, partial [Klebsiella pneumoniae]
MARSPTSSRGKRPLDGGKLRQIVFPQRQRFAQLKGAGQRASAMARSPTSSRGKRPLDGGKLRQIVFPQRQRF